MFGLLDALLFKPLFVVVGFLYPAYQSYKVRLAAPGLYPPRAHQGVALTIALSLVSLSLSLSAGSGIQPLGRGRGVADLL